MKIDLFLMCKCFVKCIYAIFIDMDKKLFFQKIENIVESSNNKQYFGINAENFFKFSLKKAKHYYS